MKTCARRIISLLLLAALLPLLSGCAGKEIRVALQTYGAALKATDDARERGEINDKTWTNVVKPARTAAKVLREQLVADYLAGKDFDWRTALVKFYDAMAPLIRQQELSGSK